MLWHSLHDRHYRQSCLLGLTLLICLASIAQAEVTLFVSPKGNDSQSGTREQPLKSLAGARDRIRTLPKEEPIRVLFAEGTYPVRKMIQFDKQDSGTRDARITYQAVPGASVRFTGGRKVTNWKSVTDPNVLARLPKVAREAIRVADLKSQGITNYGVLKPHGMIKNNPPAEAELFFDDRPMTLGRWPNEGFRGIKKKLDMQRVVIDTGRLKLWENEPDPWIFAYWHHNWAELYEPIVGLEAKSRVIKRSSTIKPNYGITPGKARWYAYNLLSEIDSPGECYLDRQNGLVYFWPTSDRGELTISQNMNLINAKSVSHVTFQGLTFECCRGNAFTFTGGTAVEVVGCTIRNVGKKAIFVTGGSKHLVYGCDVSFCGAGGISMRGGDRAKLKAAEHCVENCHVHHYSRRLRSYMPAIEVTGVGNRIAHNRIHHGPHVAIIPRGNDHIVEYNEVYNVIQETGDAGALYSGRDWTARGTKIQYNYWHDIYGSAGHGMGVYQDDQICGQIIRGNLFERCPRAVYLSGGDDHVVSNNIFINCYRSVHLDDRGLTWQKAMTKDPKGTFQQRLKAVPYQSEVWRNQYPTLAGILNDNPGAPKRNVFTKNISCGGTWDDIKPNTKQGQTIHDNLVFDRDSRWVTLIKEEDGQLKGIRFKSPSAVKRIGFEPIDVAKMGLYEDNRIATWPVPRQVESTSATKFKGKK